jgi:hypothetical protein
MVHGWPLPSCGVDRAVLLWGSICHHVKREASRFIPSILRPRHAEELRRQIRLRGHEIRVIPDAGRLAELDKPDEVAAAIIGWTA